MKRCWRSGGAGSGFHLREEAAQRDEHAVNDRVQREAVEERADGGADQEQVGPEVGPPVGREEQYQEKPEENPGGDPRDFQQHYEKEHDQPYPEDEQSDHQERSEASEDDLEWLRELPVGPADPSGSRRLRLLWALRGVRSPLGS